MSDRKPAHAASPEHIRALLAKLGMTQQAAADAICLSHRMMRYYVATDPAKARPAPKKVVLALESLLR